MEPQPLAKCLAANSTIHLFPGTTSLQDPEVTKLVYSDEDGSSQPKRKINQVVPHDIIEIDDIGSPFDDVDDNCSKQKAKMGYYEKWPNQIEDALVEDSFTSSADPGLTAGSSPSNPLKTFAHDLLDLSFSDKFNSDTMDIDDDDATYDYIDDDHIDDGDDYFEDGDNDEDFADGYDLSLDDQFDAKDLPPGVEATVPWLAVPANRAGCSTFPCRPTYSKEYEVKDVEILKRYKDFKHFDTVNDCSDHHFIDPNNLSRNSYYIEPPSKARKDSSEGGSLTNKTQKDWSKKIQQEWTILEQNLPDSIFVRAYEERMDLMRAVIIGPAGTPYHDGLFFFDIYFPSDYPAVPPRVHYHSGGLRLNPNLYACGKVCLSLLNTWSGNKNEKWTPGKSTMLQVLVSIQGLVLNAKPYFNEPGYERSAGKPDGERKSAAYNEDTFLLSCKTMMYTLRRPPKHFEDFVAGHFRERAHAILGACKAYVDGAQVCFPVGGKIAEKRYECCSSTFKNNVGQLFPKLLVEFTDNGADCRQFLPEKSDRADTALTL